MAIMELTMVDSMEGMVPTEDTTTARGPLMLRLRLSQPPLLSPAMVITEDITLTDTDTLLLTPTDIIIMARGLLMLSPAMVTTDTEDTMEDIVEDTMGMEATEATTTARGLLMLSQDTGTTAMDMEAIVGDTMGMVMVMGTDTTVEKFRKFMLIQSD